MYNIQLAVFSHVSGYVIDLQRLSLKVTILIIPGYTPRVLGKIVEDRKYEDKELLMRVLNIA